MGAKFEIGRIAGLPVLVDVSFIILVVLWGSQYFTSGNSVQMSLGFLLVVGLAVSIVLHELAHAVTGHFLGWPPSHIELNGLGGLCYWVSKSRPGSTYRANAARQVAVSLAGPAMNYGIYWLLITLSTTSMVRDNLFIWQLVIILATTNLLFAIFNMLPAFPLDGGQALNAFLSLFLSSRVSMLIVGVLGLCVAVWLAYIAIQGYGAWTLMIAAMLGLENYSMVQGAKNPPWQRWN